ncbi:MAG TPA: DUF4097 family beta strand repeat-containing protein [Symbiobacteriaceae bacterium]|nr:DUF4097 family beta strand repeat-containing protein [Symbiobacteriaceae bacterium]
MSRKVGRITLAAALMITGIVVLVDNVLGTSISWYAGRLWPGLLIMLGLEWVAASTRAQREGTKPAADAGAIIGLIVVAVIATSVSQWSRSPVRVREFRDIGRDLQIEIGPMPEVRPILPFGNVPADMVQSAGLDLNQVRELVISTTSGDVTVQEGPKALVEMRVRAYGRSTEDAEELARQVEMRVETGSRTAIKSIYPATSGRLEISFVVTMPRDAQVALKVDTSSGSINVYDHTGNVTLGTSSGSVRAERIRGTADLRTTSGSITAIGIEGDAAASSTSGSLQVEAVTGNARVGATSGSVILRDISGKVSAQSSSGSIAIDTGVMGGDWDVNAVSGGVRMTVPSSAGITVTARASSGRVSGPSWLLIGEGRNSGSGVQGGGEHKVTLRTSSGDIRLEVR